MHIIKPTIIFWLFCVAITSVYGQEKATPKASKDTALSMIDSLKAAIVTATMRPRMKGDTIEYYSEHYKMPPNTVVEELLRRLPGLHIDADGTITYNGEKIQHLLVDGEDIFGSDPTLVTRTFDASKIARVQILDRKSEQALFTGIDDGARTKTLNLVMKENAKDGYFGKVEAGGNTDDYYNANGALAAFRNREQFTTLGLASNTGVIGFTTNTGSSSSGISFLNGNTDALGASAGIGVPRFAAIALHYANTWNGPIDHLTTNYQYSHYFTQPISNSQSFQTQPDSVYGQKQQSHSSNQQDQHWIYGIYDWTPNEKSAFKFNFHASNSQGQNQFNATGTSTFNDTLVNTSQRIIRDNVSRQNVGGGLSWRIRIGNRTSRVFSASVDATKIDNSTNGYLYSLNQFYQPNGHIQSIDTVDQRKQINGHPLNLGLNITSTEPLWNGAVLGLSYVLSHSSDDPLQATFDNKNGKYQNMIDSLSSQFKTQQINQRAGLNLQGKAGHLTYTAGSDWLAYNYHEQNLFDGSLLHLHYINWAPRILFNYTPNPISNLNLVYNTFTQQPTIEELTPVTNNTDPLHITLGNPTLKPSFNQNFNLDFHRFKTWMFNLRVNLMLTANSITTKTIIDSLGRQISQPVNVSGDHTTGANLFVGRKLLGFDAGFNATTTYARTVNYINADLSLNNAYTAGGGFSLNKFVMDEFSLQLKSNFMYFVQVSSINTAAPVRYWTQSDQGALTIYLIRNFEIGTNATYTWQEKTNAFSSSTSVLLWNGYVSRNFLHNKLVAKFQLNNIMDADAGISRTNSGNVNTQNTTNILGRYWMLSATYHFGSDFRKKQVSSASKVSNF